MMGSASPGEAGEPLRLVVVARYLPGHSPHGASTYIGNMVEFLHERGARVRFLFLGETPGRWPVFLIPKAIRDRVDLRALGNVRFGPCLVSTRLFRGWILSLVRALYRALPGAWRRRLQGSRSLLASATPEPTAAELDFMAAQVGEFRPSALIVNYAWMAEAFRVAPAGVLRVMVAHDVMHERARALQEAGLPPGNDVWDREREIEWLSRADLVVALQGEDAETLDGLLQASRPVLAAPMSVRLQPESLPQVPGRCLFVGGLQEANVDGIRWFLQTCWPGVVARVPRASLHVCGDVCERLEPAPGVVLRGRVADLGPEYCQAQVVVVPLRAGSGLKIKLVQALSYGRACVTTRFGLQGLREAIDHGVLQAEEPADFASAVVGLLSDAGHRRACEQAIRAWVSRRFSAEACYGPFWRALVQADR